MSFFSDYAVYFWMIPLVFQIVLPLIILCGWGLLKLPSLIFGRKEHAVALNPALAR